jgi:hypothetical protein
MTRYRCSTRCPQSGDCVEEVGLGAGWHRFEIKASPPASSGGCHLRRHRNELGHLAEVLGGGGE